MHIIEQTLRAAKPAFPPPMSLGEKGPSMRASLRLALAEDWHYSGYITARFDY